MQSDITTKYFLQIITVLFIAYSLIGMAYGQTVPPPKPEGTPPAAVSPTPVPTPTPTAPNPNLQYLPQKAYVQSYAPEVGLPTSSPTLQAVPQVVPVQQQSAGGFDMGQITNWIGILTGAAGIGYAKLAKKKADDTNSTVQAVAENNVQQATIQQKTLEQVYENMPDKGASITNKPEIQLKAVADVKDEALKTASKA